MKTNKAPRKLLPPSFWRIWARRALRLLLPFSLSFWGSVRTPTASPYSEWLIATSPFIENLDFLFWLAQNAEVLAALTSAALAAPEWIHSWKPCCRIEPDGYTTRNPLTTPYIRKNFISDTCIYQLQWKLLVWLWMLEHTWYRVNSNSIINTIALKWYGNKFLYFRKNIFHWFFGSM